MLKNAADLLKLMFPPSRLRCIRPAHGTTRCFLFSTLVVQLIGKQWSL